MKNRKNMVKIYKRIIAFLMAIVLVFGIADVGEIVQAKTTVGVKMVSCGGFHTAILREDGSLWMTGGNSSGKLGDGTTSDKCTPIEIMKNVREVSCGYNHTAILKEDGSLWMTGYNRNGQLGDGTTSAKYAPIEIMKDVREVSSGGWHTAILKEDGSLWTTGGNSRGQLGDGTTSAKSIPIEIMKNVRAVSCGGEHTAILKEDGSLWMTGYNLYGQLGCGTTSAKYAPIEIMKNVKSVSCGGFHTAILKEDGSLWMTGSNGSGQLGDGSTSRKYTPIEVMKNVREISCGKYYTAILKEDGSLWTTGSNRRGQLGDGTRSGKSTPIEITKDVRAVSCRYEHTAILKEDGSLWMTGYNDCGQLGDGTTTNRSTPIEITFPDSSDNNSEIDGDGEDNGGEDTDEDSDVDETEDEDSDTDMDDDKIAINKFTMPSVAETTAQKGVNLSGSISISDNRTLTADEWQELLTSIIWESSDTGIIDDISCTQVESLNATNSTTFMIRAVAKKTGTATLTGTIGGKTVSCAVTVQEKDGNDDDKNISMKHVTGKLTAVDLNAMTVTVGGNAYMVDDDFSMNTAQSNMNKTVVVLLVDNKIVQLKYVCDIVEPQVKVSLSDSNVVYENGGFTKKSVELKISLTCGAKSPYRDSDLVGTEAESVKRGFSGYEVTLPNYLTINGNSKASKTISEQVAFGKKKDYNYTIDIDKDRYYPEKSTQTLNIGVTATAEGGISCQDEIRLSVGNLDISRQNVENKLINSTEGQMVDELAKVLAQTEYAMSEYGLREAGMNDTQIRGVRQAVNLWIGNIMMVDILTKDTSEDSAWAELWKAAGITDNEKKQFISKIAKEAFDQIGLDISAITGATSYMNIQNTPASTTILVPYDDNKKKCYKVYVKLNMHSYAYTSNQAFAGFGDLSYTVIDGDGNQKNGFLNAGEVTYANLETFAKGTQAICESFLKKSFKDNIGGNAGKAKEFCRQVINDTTGNKIVELLTSDIVNKIANKAFGSFSDNIYSLFYKGKLYKVPKDIMDILCPVDVFVYDSDGNLCGSIENNEITYAADDIFLYVEGDKKHVMTFGNTYNLVLKGTADGTMKYVVSEYSDDELLRRLEYENIPLTEEIAYKSTIPYTQKLDSEVYNPVCNDEKMTMILPTIDWKEPVQDVDIPDNTDDTKKDDTSVNDTDDTKKDDTSLNDTEDTKKDDTSVNTTEDTKKDDTSLNKTDDTQKDDNSVNTTEDTKKDDTSVNTTEDTQKNDISLNDTDDNKNLSSESEMESVRNEITASDVAISKKSYVYNGKAKKPAVKVYDHNGKKISKDNYTVSYSNNKNVGTATVIIILRNEYSGTIEKNFTIQPKEVKLKSLVGKENTISIKWQKQKVQTSGYQIQYSTNKKFVKKSTVTKVVKKNTTTQLGIKKLQSKKKYFVRVRSYKTVNGKKYYSKWSKVKAVVTKK